MVRVSLDVENPVILGSDDGPTAHGAEGADGRGLSDGLVEGKVLCLS
jgi:hypothetical protein